MISKIKKIGSLISQPKKVMTLLSMPFSGYLYDIGWFNAFDEKAPVDGENSPIPWVTYSFIDFIQGRLNDSLDVFEYGAGNSTHWYAEKVKTVTSVEHDVSWFNSVKDKMPSNVNLNYQELIYGGEYSNYSNSLNEQFDMVIVDGRDRVNCVKNSILSLNDKGIIVLDDSERESYLEALIFLKKHGFKKIDFWGISPGLFYKKNTTIFYKQDNCLGI